MVAWLDGRRKASTELWRQTRYLAFMQILNNGFIKGVDKPRKPEDLFKLEGDYEIPERTLKEMQEHYDKVLDKWRLKRN